MMGLGRVLLHIRFFSGIGQPVSLSFLVYLILFPLLVLISSQPAVAQATTPQPQAPSESSTSAPTVRVRVNLVEVPVVVRDRSGHAVGNLTRENFQLFDNHKLQDIAQFNVERFSPPDSAAPRSTVPGFIPPVRFTVLLFDDIHLTDATLPTIRAAALRRFANGLAPAERVAIFTATGKVTLDFTDNPAKLIDAINRLQFIPPRSAALDECTVITFEEANRIINQHDESLLSAKASEIQAACFIKERREAVLMALSQSERSLNMGDANTRQLLSAITVALGRLSTAPGQRNLVVLSPGLFISDVKHTEFKVIDLAVRNRIVISALDVRGVLTDDDTREEVDPLAELTDGTGGTLYHNRNDLDEGLRRLSVIPEYVYTLAFSPVDMKFNGFYHNLTVKLVAAPQLSIAWRRGYFAPQQPSDSSQSEKDDVSSALYSSNASVGLPIEMRSQIVKGNDPTGKLTVSAIVDLQDLPHRELNGRRVNSLRIVAAVFDRNGAYLGAFDQTIGVRWTDKTARPYTAASYDFILDPGDYLVRLVIRDTVSQQLFSQSSTVQIP